MTQIINVPQRNAITIAGAKRVLQAVATIETHVLPELAALRETAETLLYMAGTRSKGPRAVEEEEPDPEPLFTDEEWDRLTDAQRAAFARMMPFSDDTLA